MAKGFNKVILMGNLTRDPETRTTPNGQTVTSFALAVNRRYRNSNGEDVENVSYINCVAWGKPGEIIAQYVTKGRPLLVSGRLEQRSWDDKESGQKRSLVEVIVEDFNFIDSRSGGSDFGGSASAPAAAPKAGKKTDDVVIEDIGDEPINLDDIPF